MIEPTSVLDVQRLCGLAIAADFPLHQSRPSSHAPDVVVTTGASIPRADAIPAGELLLDFAEEDDHWYSLTRDDDGRYLFRVYTICDFRIEADLSQAELHMVQDVDPGMASILTVGAFVALQLYLRGHLVLHASAVQVDAGAFAIMGHSGMGKSTLAALLCADGAQLVSDDVVGVTGGVAPRVAPGATEVRLRPGTGLLEERLAGAENRVSADSREVVHLASAQDEEIPLAAVLIPWPNRDDRFEMERLPGVQAAFALLQYPRLMGWRDPSVVRQSFEQASKIAASVPVFRAHVPWGPPFRDGIGRMIREAISAASTL